MITATGFFCEACLIDKPLDDLSKDARYCISCFAFLTNEVKRLERKIKPGWAPRKKGTVESLRRRKYPPQTEMIADLAKHHGWGKEDIQKNIQKNAIKRKWSKLQVRKSLDQNSTENITPPTPPRAPQPLPALKNPVTKIVDKGIIPPSTEKRIMLHAKKRGRPRKKADEPISRMTEYRHRKEKELQGVLL